MKRVSKPVFFIVAILVLALSYFAIFGFTTQYGDIKTTVIKGVNDIRWGIDIKGGVEATFKPAGDVDATDEEMEAAKAVIETRLVSSNITDYELYADSSSDRIIVRFPWKEDEENFDPEKAIEEISATALLTFRPGNSYASTERDANGNLVCKTPTGETEEVLMDGSNVAKAEPVMDTSKGTAEYMVSLTLKDASIFKDITEKYLKKTVSIWMDDIMLSAPTVNDVISNGEATITGDFTAQEATDLANKINAGALPFELETASFGTISPTLGASSLTAMAYAAIAAVIILALLMIIVYRLPGFVASIALIGQVGLMVATISGFFPVFSSFTMTLPGIAGLILSIGMGVDANIITAERIREELRSGKTIDTAIAKGSKSSFSAIFDGNVTVIIVALILLLVFGPSNILSVIFGQSTTGTIYAFGYTLLMGVVANFVMGVFASRLMLKSISGFKIFRKKFLYGGVGK
ncbi:MULTISPECIES: protein translocase subunit SecD [unclassified Ruminococcus]|uniref:protein translocase subunit SecD n=1 Tax=unclassified Ruminococcus TaxID=2608920 RepID=UPI00210AC923|nr:MULTISPECIES: protein translocase subunit SecD [unclassified Ruminococcus]MCQ4022756.1 protein translocase subunit SecD [Ruminococcus sp. zg-924]MCQ4114996.1 protein translocase subunit SecD [Ruminococcus sp. zg-921]